MTVYGVDANIALSFKAAVDDSCRFKSSRTVAAHFGPTSRRYRSEELDNPGRISRLAIPMCVAPSIVRFQTPISVRKP
jgi:transposase